MYIRSWGSEASPLVILLHAQGCHSGWWDQIGPMLAEAGYFAIAPDLRGHGQSPRADEYSWDSYAADIETLVGDRSYALVGHSMGGYIGLQVAARGIKPPTKLVIADMKLAATEQELTELDAAARRPGRAFGSLSEAVERYRLSPPQHCVPPDVLRRVAEASFQQQPDSSWAACFDRRALAIEPLDPAGLAANVSCPALVIRGEQSEIMPKDGALALATALRGSLVELSDRYHHLPLEAPAEMASAIISFLA